jgi:hypothetical protein
VVELGQKKGIKAMVDGWQKLWRTQPQKRVPKRNRWPQLSVRRLDE